MTYGYHEDVSRVGVAATRRANRSYWDGAASSYVDEHTATLGVVALVWGPEGLDEDDAQLLGDPARLAGLVALEVGCGAAQGTRWAAAHGALAVGIDLSAGMLGQARTLGRELGRELDRELDQRHPDRAGNSPALVLADAGAIPLASGCVDVAFSAYGALPFVADAVGVLREVARVLRPGGRFTFSVTHPVRWAFPDDPGPAGLVADRSYFDRRPYTERDEDGELLYAEHHRTLGDWVTAITSAGLVLERLTEPTWARDSQPTWGGWSALRGRVLPGTAIFSCRRP